MITVMPWERAVLYRRGRFDRILESGSHRVSPLGRRVRTVDTRIRTIKVAGQEIPTADQVSVKVSAHVTLRVVDPRRWVETTEDPQDHVYDAIKLAVRRLVRAAAFEDVATGIAVEAVPPSVAEAAAHVGASIESFEVVDVVVPGDVRRAAAELVAARRQAQVAMEQARSQTAVLRHLANVSSVLEANPALASLRLVETAAEHGGSIVIERPGPASR